MQKTKIIAVCAITLFVVIASLFAVILFHTYPSAFKNKRVMMDYIELTHGSDYQIIKSYLGKTGASGRQDDILTIAQDGLTYEVCARNGQVVDDTYENRLAGIQVIDYLKQKVSSEQDINRYEWDGTVYHSELDWTLPEEITSVEELLHEKFNLQITVYLDKTEQLQDLTGLYDCYKTVSEQVGNLILSILVIEESNRKEAPSYQFGCIQTEERRGSTISPEEFFARFHYYGA